MLAVNVTARLKPPEISGISMASVKKPELGQLERDRYERARREEAIGREAHRDDHDDEKAEQTGDIGGNERLATSAFS